MDWAGLMQRKIAISAILGLMITGMTAHGQQVELPLVVGQTIEQANNVLIKHGWRADPLQTPGAMETELSGLKLISLSSCSGTGVGFCRYDYRRGQQHLSIVTIPSDPGSTSVGLVERWW